jgi:hypothetical protein
MILVGVMGRIALLVIILLLTAAAASATTFKWQDAKGIHYSDDLNAVPEELRSREQPEDEAGVVTFGKPAPFNNSSALRQQNLQQSERLDRERDRIVMEGIRQHQEEMLSRLARDRSTLQAHFVRLFAHRGVVWIVPLLLLLYFWLATLGEIMGRDFPVPGHKYRWLVAVLLLVPFGMAAYYLLGRAGTVAPPQAAAAGRAGFLARFTARLRHRKQGSR